MKNRKFQIVKSIRTRKINTIYNSRDYFEASTISEIQTSISAKIHVKKLIQSG